MVFSVVMYGCESWTIKKAESQRMDAFELWCWRRLLRVPWTARRSNQSTLKEISPEIRKSLKEITHWKDWWWSWNSNTLATWCKVTHLKRPWCWERLKVGGEGDDRGWDGWMTLPTQWTGVWVDSGSWWWARRPDMLQSMGSQRVRHDWATELNWTEVQIRTQVRNLPRGVNIWSLWLQRCPCRYPEDTGRVSSFRGRKRVVLPVFPHKGFLTTSREKTQRASRAWLGAQQLAEGRLPENLLLQWPLTVSLPL